MEERDGELSCGSEEEKPETWNPFDLLSLEGDEVKGDTLDVNLYKPKTKTRKKKEKKEVVIQKTEYPLPEEGIKSVEKDFLVIYPKYFDVKMEIKRMFGGSVFSDDKKPKLPAGSKTFALKSVLLPHLIHSSPLWALSYAKSATHISMIMAGSGDDKTFSFYHDQQYQQMELDFFYAVESFDPEAIQQLLAVHKPPFHINSLLAMSDIYRHSGHHQQASECVEMALFVMERSFHPLFRAIEHTLDYACYENRAFFLAIFRHIDHVSRKGCWRACFELCKLLFHLDPSDPLGVSYMIDFYALQSHQYEFLLSDSFEKLVKNSGIFPPQFYYSRALACINQGDSNVLSKEYLLEGIRNYPLVLISLCKSKNVASLQLEEEMSLDGQSLLDRLYVERCHVIWKQQENSQWLQKTLNSLLEEGELDFSSGNSPSSFDEDVRLCRHVYMLDDQNISIPSTCKLIQGRRSRYQLQRHDPFPDHERTNSPIYDSYFKELRELELPRRGLVESLVDSLHGFLSLGMQ